MLGYQTKGDDLQPIQPLFLDILTNKQLLVPVLNHMNDTTPTFVSSTLSTARMCCCWAVYYGEAVMQDSDGLHLVFVKQQLFVFYRLEYASLCKS